MGLNHVVSNPKDYFDPNIITIVKKQFWLANIALTLGLYS